MRPVAASRSWAQRRRHETVGARVHRWQTGFVDAALTCGLLAQVEGRQRRRHHVVERATGAMAGRDQPCDPSTCPRSSASLGRIALPGAVLVADRFADVLVMPMWW